MLVEEALQFVQRLTGMEKWRRDLFSKLAPNMEPTPIPITWFSSTRRAATFHHLFKKSHFKAWSSWKDLPEPAVQLSTDPVVA